MARHGVNAVWLIGRLDTAPHLRDPESQRAVATATLVTQRQTVGKRDHPMRDEYHKLRASGFLAEKLGQLSIGAELFVEGSLRTSVRDGQRVVDQPKFIELDALEILVEPDIRRDLDEQRSAPIPDGAGESAVAGTEPSIHARDDSEPDPDEISPPPTQIIRPD